LRDGLLTGFFGPVVYNVINGLLFLYARGTLEH
jgi:hypothetical protein